MFLQLFWVVSVTVGALGGTLIPDRVVGLEFAMTGLFLVLGVEAFKARRDLPTPLAAVACVIFGRMVAPEQMLVVSLGLFTLSLILRYQWPRHSRGRSHGPPCQSQLKGQRDDA